MATLGEPPDCRDSDPAYRGGLAPARLRRVVELVHAKIEDEVTLDELAESAVLSTAHCSQMFRKSSGNSPHQLVLHRRVERAKEMLRTAEARVRDQPYRVSARSLALEAWALAFVSSGSEGCNATHRLSGSAGSLRQKLPHGKSNFLDVCFQCEVTRIKKLDSRVGVISSERLSTSGDEIRIVSPPDSE
jgi:AraC-like DNA-binding protein